MTVDLVGAAVIRSRAKLPVALVHPLGTEDIAGLAADADGEDVEMEFTPYDRGCDRPTLRGTNTSREHLCKCTPRSGCSP